MQVWPAVVVGAIGVVLLGLSCQRRLPPDRPGAPRDGRGAEGRPAPAGPATASPIGVATMAGDGTITLMLRALSPGALGEAVLVYPPAHPEYDRIRQHIGPIEPGGTVPVRPWPDGENSADERGQH
jgi:hypothetical protein